jgi:chromosome segregation ATPase
MNKEENPLDWAETVLEHVGKQKLKWGKLYEVGKDAVYSADDIARAASIVFVELKESKGVSKADLTNANRQLAASKAREARAKKKIANLEEKLDLLEHTLSDTNEALSIVTSDKEKLKQQLLDQQAMPDIVE